MIERECSASAWIVFWSIWTPVLKRSFRPSSINIKKPRSAPVRATAACMTRAQDSSSEPAVQIAWSAWSPAGSMLEPPPPGVGAGSRRS